MGLLGFKKSSRKQGPKPSPPHPIESSHTPFLLHQLDHSSPAIPKPSETSLMDDIMKELDNSSFSKQNLDANRSPIKRKQFTPLLNFDQPTTVPTLAATSSTPLVSYDIPISPPISPPTTTEPRTVSPKPLIPSTNRQLLHSDDESESDEEQVSKQRYSVPLVNRYLMNRMRERHRQEVRKSVSSIGQEIPSSLASTSATIPEKQRTVIQSHSFTTAHNAPRKRQQGQLVRSASAITNLVPIQTQSSTSTLSRHLPLASAPTFNRNSFSHLPVQTLSVTTEEKEEAVDSKKFQINRSASAYPISPPTPSIQVQQELKRHEEEMKLKLELQEMKRHQELQIQHEVQKQQQQIIAQQQQQLQQLQHQQQLFIQQQQYQQQQQQQQLLLQQQQIQKLQQQSSLEAIKVATTAATTAKPKSTYHSLYDRSSSSNIHKCKQHDYHHHSSNHQYCNNNNSDEDHTNKATAISHMVSPVPLPFEMMKQQQPQKPQQEENEKNKDNNQPPSVNTEASIKSIRSSASILGLKEEENKEESEPKKRIKLPIKLKRELENMQLGRSAYSLPDLSILSKEAEEYDVHWDSIEVPKRIKKVEEPVAKEMMATANTPPVYLYYLNDCHRNHNRHHHHHNHPKDHCHKEHVCQKKYAKKHSHHCPRSTSKTDLTTLSNTTTDNITTCLRSRYNEYKIYTNIGSRHIIALNPLKQLSINDDQTSLEYVAAYKDATNHQQSSGPHLFDLINRVYFHMRRTGSDQTVVLRGDSGSGKSDLRKLTIRHLVRLSSHKKESKVQTQILESQRLLEAFGHCQTGTSSSSSRFGYYSEIQFNERGRMVGSKTLHYSLESSRVTGDCVPASLDGNFNIFYYLLAGVSPEEKATLQLIDVSSYPYLQKFSKRSISSVDAQRFEELKLAMKTCGFRKEQIGRIIQLVATILHLGNLSFVDPAGTGTQEAAFVKNTELLDLVADFLGLDPHALENVLTFKTTMIRKDVTTLILNAEQAAQQRDELCQVLYSLLFSWIVEKINSKTCIEDFTSFIGVLDFPGLQSYYSVAGFEQLTINLANERIQEYIDHTMFRLEADQYRAEGVHVPDVNPQSSALDLLTRPKGICHEINTMTDVSKRAYTDNNIMDSIIKYNTTHSAFSVKNSDTSARHFVIQHYGNTPVEYSTQGFIAQNNSQISVDFLSLFKGGMDVQPSWNSFIVELFANVKTQNHPKHNTAIISAQQSAKPMRGPSQRRSTRRKGGSNEKGGNTTDNSTSATSTVLSQIQSALDELIASFEEAKLWVVYCILPKYKETGSVDTKLVQSQIDSFRIPSLLQLPAVSYVESYNHQDFLDRYGHLFQELDTTRLLRSQCEMAAGIMNWTTPDMSITQNKVFLSAVAWRELEDQLRSYEKIEQRQARDHSREDETSVSHPFSGAAAAAAAAGLPLPPQNHYDNDTGSFYSEDESGHYMENDGSLYGSESYFSQQGGLALVPQQEPVVENLDETEEDEARMTPARKRWLYFVTFCTWWIPSKFLIWCGRMKRKDVRVAWREKVTLCMLIFLLCAFIIWFLVFFSEAICPKENVYSTSELANHGKDNTKGAYVAIRGEVFHLTNFAPHHYPQTLVPTSSVMEYAGTDATDLFPVQVSALCEGVSPYVSLDYTVNLTDSNAQYHDFRYTSDAYNPNWYYDQMTLLRKNYKVGNMGYDWKSISDQAKSTTTINGIKALRIWAVIDNRVYDLTTYTMGGRYAKGPGNAAAPSGIDTNFLNPQVVELFQQQSGNDISSAIRNLNLDAATLERELVCLRNLYFVGFLDERNSTKCQFSTYLLLVVTILLAAVIIFKFIAALRFGGRRAPEEHDKFVICQVTCYTEDEGSLRKTIDSIARLDYDDKRKLLFVICDGMIIGSGNDKPTPRIVLDILGVDPQVDPEPLSFVSVGEGAKQHNMAKIYSGLYEVAGHVVPYIVVAKCGNPRERQKPGNRGKRDSQLVLMQFLNRVHYDAPMNPMQLEVYHQMKNVIGVSPHFYEFVLMVDADTEVMPDGLNFLVASAVHDSKIIGICGETNLSNEKDTWVTMIQVYEYFISHHLIKSFESLFSTVSCLPGCFTMYRVRTVDGKRALFISNEVIADYSVNIVDTLHKKNLLHLGEDRYLTTLLLKHFADFKTKFTPDAKCQTNAPDLWSVLVSQRRRWINSTVHNLGELIFLPRLCGFCCFSMRFIVMLDLISTLAMPALLGYLGYLIYTLATLDGDTVPIITIATIAGTYGLQALLFVVKGRWEFIMWMLVSILAMPVFSFYIPVYSYWHFDDFSWGNTRVVVGEKGKKVAVVADEGTFDPKSIPTMKWSDYEQQLLSEDQWSDNISHSSGYTHGSRGYPHTGSESVYGAPSGMMMMPDNMSVYSAARSQQQRQSMGFDHNSMVFPSNNSMPMMPYGNGSSQMLPSSRSMASFAPAQQLNSPGQYIPLQTSSQFNKAPSSHSLLMDGFEQGDGIKNEEIMIQVQRILETADLTKVTKKQVREELQNYFGVSMQSRKDYINACIENVLQNHV
ncbi:hypothetical protein G6F57_001697 [Rhizopus arrhizus]|nr:hypothetical protein G6F23_002640 [Rhizopus arrhizus]KAG1421201.1 hypothetical protein G6F58_003850 [Rhizopus delemar]KAG0985462.1 hypothetical protein G6F29_004005 [Rhizopus arrhizus]KAG0996981.1 hypothetical protein G6F28_003333 [Rhizopus arrhizus]KAG1010948.1 hypothetical protein G6F27_004181 [Rhizopus arrhizus]